MTICLHSHLDLTRGNGFILRAGHISKGPMAYTFQQGVFWSPDTRLYDWLNPMRIQRICEMDTSELEYWFSEKCDGDWEHQGGVEITTTDNPGWHAVIAYDDMDVGVQSDIADHNVDRSDTDYIIFSYDEKKNTVSIACGAMNLSEAFAILRRVEKAKLKDFLLFVANDEDCLLPDVIRELYQRFEVDLDTAVGLFRSMADFITSEDCLEIGKSEKLYQEIKPVEKSTFFATAWDDMFTQYTPPLYYLTYRPLHRKQ